MIRTQIQLSEVQARRVRVIARREGVSMAEVIRRSVDRMLETDEPDVDDLYARAAAVVGQYEDVEGAPDVATRHDDYLASAFE